MFLCVQGRYGIFVLCENCRGLYSVFVSGTSRSTEYLNEENVAKLGVMLDVGIML